MLSLLEANLYEIKDEEYNSENQLSGFTKIYTNADEAYTIEYGEKTYMFPTIINARLSEPSEDGGYFGPEAKSYSLRLGSEIDPERRCAMRIVYAPGKRIEWSEDELAQIFASLK